VATLESSMKKRESTEEKLYLNIDHEKLEWHGPVHHEII